MSRQLDHAGAHSGATVAAIEALEGRTLLTTVVVDSASDLAIGGTRAITLRRAVAIANSSATPTTITFSTSLFGSAKTIALIGGQLELAAKQPVTITGPAAGVTISGGNKSRVFLIDSGVTAALARLTISNGKAPAANSDGTAEGGGIENNGNLTLSKCLISGNMAVGVNKGQGLGGGVESSGPLVVQDSTINGNTALGGTRTGAYFGYVGYFGGGGGVYGTSSVTITGSKIIGNTARGGDAPHIGKFDGNGGGATGGGIYASGPLTLTSSDVANNNVTGGLTQEHTAGTAIAGGIFSGSTATITSTTVSGNAATGGTGENYGSNGASARGGGVYGTSLIITDSTVERNHATAGPGIISSARAFGGGVYSSKSLTLVQSTLSGNVAKGANGSQNGFGTGLPGGMVAGGGLYSANTLSITTSTISSNSAVGGDGAQSQEVPPTTAGNGGIALGGGIACGGNSTITDSTVAGNDADGGRGGDASFMEPGANGGEAEGGGVYASGNIKLLDSTLSGNSVAGGAGGASYVFMPQPSIHEPGGATGSAIGGGLRIAAGNALANNTVLSGNQAPLSKDIVGALAKTSSHNLIGIGGGLANGVNGNRVGITNPKLSTLGNNGGSTQTMVPLTGSPAINRGDNSLIPPAILADQRGLPRISGGVVDIGAVEVQGAGGASIAGTVYNDANRDGIRQSNEAGLANWQVYVDQNNNGVFDGGEITTFTATNGTYRFTGLMPGTYILREVRQVDYTRTEPAGNYPLGFYKLTVAANQAVIAKDFGNFLD